METTRKIRPKHNSAFSLVELLAVVAIVAIIGTIAITVISKPKTTLEQTKLEQDVARLNTAVKVFLSNGGSLEDIDTAQDVITELKKAANSDGQEKVVGIRGSMIDNRLFADYETDGEYKLRANWDNTTERFTLSESTTGVGEFTHKDSLAGVDYGSAPRQTKLVYNDADGWVWESQDFSFASNTGPSTVPTINAPTLDATGGTGSSNTAKLGTPVISPGSGARALIQFPVTVAIAKQPSDPNGANVFYSVEPNVWVLYTAPFSVEPGTSVQAFTSADDPTWEDSDPATATFTNNPENLAIALNIPKNPINFAEAGGALEAGDYTAVNPVGAITVSFPSDAAIPDTYENSDNFRIRWTYDGSDPRSNSNGVDGGAFSNGYVSDSIDYGISKWDGASLLPIQVVAKAENTSVVTNSPILTANIGINRTTLPQPAIIYSEDTSRGDTVTMLKNVDSGEMPVGARVYYTTDGTDPGDDGSGNPLSGTLYTGPFDPLADSQFTTDADIVARIYPPQEYAQWFTVSQANSSAYSVPPWEISGDASGWFSHAVGPSGMVSNIWGNQTNDYFQWGNPGNWGTGANWLDFSGSSFEDVAPDERFQVGNLSYYNGTISLSSLATAVDFTVQLAFGGTAKQFDYSFDLLTTPNNGTSWQNADYVWFNDTASAQTVSLYGADYSLNLEFGETSQFGFSSIDQFHVQESQSASANLYATLVSLGSWW